MSKQIPFIHRRGDTFHYRISVPLELREITGCREMTMSLRTSDRLIAQPIALELAAISKRLFFDLRKIMANSNSKLDMMIRMKIAQEQIKQRWLKEQHEAEVDRLQEVRRQDLRVHNAKIETYKEIFSNSKFATESPENSKHPELNNANLNPNKVEASSPKLSHVIDSFLKSYSKDKHPDMYKKHQSSLPMFLKIVGDKPVSEIKQFDIKSFFTFLETLPPRWSDECRKRKISIVELAKIKHPKTITEKTFNSTYVASIRPFLISAQSDWQDQGFPTTLTTAGIEYHGTRVEGENSQRPIKPDELKRLFGSNEMVKYVEDVEQVHKYWLPLIGLYTGARVNEICQINPQTDILKEEVTDIYYFWITDKTDGDERINKRTKNLVSTRKVPIHSALINRGILKYVERIKQEGHKLLLPGFKPLRGKASASAEKWFTQHLKDVNLRDDTPHEKLTGMHAFRSTFSNAAMNAGVDESSIVGHAHNVDEAQAESAANRSSKVKRGYRRELSLVNKQKIIEQVMFDLIPMITSV